MPGGLDPALAAQLVARDGPGTPVIDAPGSSPVAARPGQPEPDLGRVAEPPGTQSVPGLPDGSIGQAGEVPAIEAPVIAVEPKPAARKRRWGFGKKRKAAREPSSRQSEAKVARSGRNAAARTGGKRPRSKGRTASRLVSLALLVAVGVLGYRWVSSSGLLETDGTDRVAITVPRTGIEGENAPPPDWTELLTREIAGAIEPLTGGDALRVNGRGEVALDAAALAALGPEIAVSLQVRAAGAGGEFAVSCDFPGGGCGRVRFQLPREAEERLVMATIGEGGEARLVLDATVSGETVPFDLLGVSARSR